MTPHQHQNRTLPKKHYALVQEHIDKNPYRPATSQIRFWNGLVHLFKLNGYVSENNYTALATKYKHSHAVARQIQKSHIQNGFITEIYNVKESDF